MGYECDPEGIEAAKIGSFVRNMRGRRVMEVGCGSGRLTPLFAKSAKTVIAIDPDADKIKQAKEALAPKLRQKVRFYNRELETFKAVEPFDWVVLSWSL